MRTLLLCRGCGEGRSRHYLFTSCVGVESCCEAEEKIDLILIYFLNVGRRWDQVGPGELSLFDYLLVNSCAHTQMSEVEVEKRWDHME